MREYDKGRVTEDLPALRCIETWAAHSMSESKSYGESENVISGCVTCHNVTLKVHLQWGQ